jgi:hypothetical protein
MISWKKIGDCNQCFSVAFSELRHPLKPEESKRKIFLVLLFNKISNILFGLYALYKLYTIASLPFAYAKRADGYIARLGVPKFRFCACVSDEWREFSSGSIVTWCGENVKFSLCLEN